MAKKPPHPDQKYQNHRDREAARQEGYRKEAREIGSLPPVKNKERKELCRNSLRLYCETYRKEAFNQEWSEDHLRVIKRLEQVILQGGLFAIAMPRGSGKTSLTMAACEWAILYAHRHWVCLIGATENKAQALLKGIKTSFRFNQALYEDFPEVCFPIRALEGQAKRTIGQTMDGNETNMSWGATELMLPSVPGSPTSGAMITVAGITGDIRGQQRILKDGSIIRPDVAILDDPQTRESAGSGTQTESRMSVIKGDVLGLAGPGVPIAAVVPCTVVYRNDLADQLLDKEVNPEWHSERTKMLYGAPEHQNLWDEYAEIRRNEMRNDGDGSRATAFYLANREKMDLGLRAAWESRKTPSEVSAIQHAMNLRIRDEVSFLAEYQNEPVEVQEDSGISEKEITEKVSGLPRGVVDDDASKLVAFVDVQKEALFYVVCCFENDYTGHIIDYGAWPDQKTTNFSYMSLRDSIGKRFPGLGLEDALKAALNACCEHLLDRTWSDQSGSERSVQRLLVDANWGQSRNAIYQWARTCRWKSIAMPSHGKGIGASTEPLNARFSKKPGTVVGTHWRIMRGQDIPIRYVLYDANYWKSFVSSRWVTQAGTRGSLQLYQAAPHVHETFAKHMKSEVPHRVEAKGSGRTVDEWKLKPGQDNHWLDCVVGCHVAAGIEGCALGDRPAPSGSGSPKRGQRVVQASTL